MMDLKVNLDCVSTLEELEKLISSLDTLEIAQKANKAVFGEGPQKPEVMVIGEAPGAQEDLEGRPFCGRSGKLLDKMLESISLNRLQNTYITNSVFWRPEDNRKPMEEEIKFCRPYLYRHISLRSPKILLLLGATALYSILDNTQPISQSRGKILYFKDCISGREIPTIASFHPSYLLRSPDKKGLAYADLLLLKATLESKRLMAS